MILSKYINIKLKHKQLKQLKHTKEHNMQWYTIVPTVAFGG